MSAAGRRPSGSAFWRQTKRLEAWRARGGKVEGRRGEGRLEGKEDENARKEGRNEERKKREGEGKNK